MTERRQSIIGSTKTNLDAGLVKRIYDDADKEVASSSSGKNSSGTTTQTVQGEDPSNIQDGTSNPDNFLKGWTPTYNEMSELYQPSYHFSFYLDDDVTASPGSGNEFVIAETGLTGMNIQEVNIDSFVGPNVRTRNATATNIEIKIYEPMGAMFPDLLFQAAVRKNIYNYLKAPWHLKLKLHGYDQQGNYRVIGSGWTWKLTLLEIQSKISENGALHTISALPISEVALNNQYCMIPDGTSIDGTTVGEAMGNLMTSLNKGVNKKYGETNPPFIEYAIKDMPYPYDTKVGVSKPFDHKITSSSEIDSNVKTTTTYGTQTSQYAPGTDIPGILDTLFARCETAVKMARNSRELPPQSSPDTESTIRDVASFLHRIDTQVEYTGYDVVLGDYCKKITYIVKPYSSLRLLTSMGRAMAFDKEKSLNKNKAAHAIEKKFLQKQYDYIFTGLNTEVEKFDIQTNFRWAVSVPQLQGWVSNQLTAGRVDPTLVAQTHTNQLAYFNQTLAETDKTIAEVDAIRAAQGYDKESEEGKATEAKRARLQAARDKHEKAIGVLSKSVGAERDKINSAAQEKINNARKATPQGRIVDGEDDVYENVRDGGAGYGGAGRGDSSYLPITIVQDPDDPAAAVAPGSSNDNNANKSVYGALLNQLYGSMDGNLQAIELDIKGDPYWLGPGNSGTPYDEWSTSSTPNFMNGEHIFVFRFKLPLGYDSVTGTVALNKGANDGNGSSATPANGAASTGGSSNIFTGFYATTQVTHHFRDGGFSQTLSGVRIPGWYYENIIEGRENTVDEDVIYSNSQSPASQYGATGDVKTVSRGSSRVNTTGLTDQELLAITLVGEAGGEGRQGMQAVGNVIINRVNANYRGQSTVSGVITDPSQFSVWNGINPASKYEEYSSRSSYSTAYELAGQMLAGGTSDITGGATSYLNVTVTKQQRGGSLPSWYQSSKVTTKIGNHTFLKGV
jgi:spore germination cell wall hydrolase CwlJ-like protein